MRLRRSLTSITLITWLAACGEVKPREEIDAGVDPPETCADVECSPYATCDDSGGTAVCTCNDGFSGNGVACMDVNECATGASNCHADAVCINQVGSFQCVCREGFAGDGVTQCAPIWALVHSEPGHLGPWHHAVGVGPRIYYSRDDTEPAVNFFRSYDTGTNMVRAEGEMDPSENDLCACGFGGELVPVAMGGLIYYFGNYGHSYRTQTQVWAAEPYPDMERRGESAQDAVAGVVYRVGGRAIDNSPTDSTFGYSPMSGGWSSHGRYPVPFDRGAATGLNGRLYVIASSSGAGPIREFHVFDPSADTWSPLPPPPGDYVEEMVAFRGKVIALFGTEMHAFDPMTNAWEATVHTLPPGAGGWNAHLAVTDAGLFAVISNEAMDRTEFWRYTQ